MEGLLQFSELRCFKFLWQCRGVGCAISQLFSSDLFSGKFCLVSELNILFIVGRKFLGDGRQDICKDKECNFGPVAGY